METLNRLQAWKLVGDSDSKCSSSNTSDSKPSDPECRSVYTSDSDSSDSDCSSSYTSHSDCSDSDCSSSYTSDSVCSDSEYGFDIEDEAEAEDKADAGYYGYLSIQFDRMCKFEKLLAESTLPPELVDEIRSSGHSHYLSARQAFNAQGSLRLTLTTKDAAHVMAEIIQSTPLSASIVRKELVSYALRFSKDEEGLELAMKFMKRYPNVPYFYYAAALSSSKDLHSSSDTACDDTVSFCDAGLSVMFVKAAHETSFIHLELLRIASASLKSRAHIYRDGLVVQTKTQVDDLKRALMYAEEYIRFAAPDVPDFGYLIAETIAECGILTVWSGTHLRLKSAHFFPSATGASGGEKREHLEGQPRFIASFLGKVQEKKHITDPEECLARAFDEYFHEMTAPTTIGLEERSLFHLWKRA
ncbi:hypothetical protein HK102_005252, partial [Quaeritorhiza haematococci]